MTKPLFCANCQEDKDQKVTINRGEIIFTCECGRFKKFVATMTVDELREAMSQHRAVNKGLKLVRTDQEARIDGMSHEQAEAILKDIQEL